MSVPELIMLLEDALRGRYGGIVRAKGILETGGGYVRFDLADGLYSITGADGVSTEPPVRIHRPAASPGGDSGAACRPRCFYMIISPWA